MERTTIYLLSGLGADERIFKSLTFPQGFEIKYLSWLPPTHAKEPLADYCRRLAAQIDTSAPFVLAGLSFGGMVCCALNDIVSPIKTILLSSVATRSELPQLYKFAGMAGIARVLPGSAPTPVMPMLKWYMGVETDEDRQLVEAFIADGLPDFNKWAMYKVTHWKKVKPPQNLYQIHGTRDRIFPVGKTRAGYLIKDGGHFMVLNKAAEVSAILAKILTG